MSKRKHNFKNIGLMYNYLAIKKTHGVLQRRVSQLVKRIVMAYFLAEKKGRTRRAIMREENLNHPNICRKNPACDNGLAEHKTGSLPDTETGK